MKNPKRRGKVRKEEIPLEQLEAFLFCPHRPAAETRHKRVPSVQEQWWAYLHRWLELAALAHLEGHPKSHEDVRNKFFSWFVPRAAGKLPPLETLDYPDTLHTIALFSWEVLNPQNTILGVGVPFCVGSILGKMDFLYTKPDNKIHCLAMQLRHDVGIRRHGAAIEPLAVTVLRMAMEKSFPGKMAEIHWLRPGHMSTLKVSMSPGIKDRIDVLKSYYRNPKTPPPMLSPKCDGCPYKRVCR